MRGYFYENKVFLWKDSKQSLIKILGKFGVGETTLKYWGKSRSSRRIQPLGCFAKKCLESLLVIPLLPVLLYLNLSIGA